MKMKVKFKRDIGKIVMKVTSDDLKIKASQGYSTELNQILHYCLNIDQSKRKTSTQIFNKLNSIYSRIKPVSETETAEIELREVEKLGEIHIIRRKITEIDWDQIYENDTLTDYYCRKLSYLWKQYYTK